MFDKENKINHLLSSKDSQQSPIHAILSIILSPQLENIFKRYDTFYLAFFIVTFYLMEGSVISAYIKNIPFHFSIDMQQLISKFKPITNFVMSESINTRDNLVDWLLKHLPANNNTLALWAALSESIYESRYDLNASNLCNVLLWPLKYMALFNNVSINLNI